MSPEPPLIDTLRLENGLELRFHDLSRKVAGDRWYVTLEVRATIEMDPSLLEGVREDPSEYRQFQEEAGPTLEYRQERQRIFVPENEVNDALLLLKEEITASQLAYLSRKDFRARYTKLRFADWKEKKWLQNMMNRGSAD